MGIDILTVVLGINRIVVADAVDADLAFGTGFLIAGTARVGIAPEPHWRPVIIQPAVASNRTRRIPCKITAVVFTRIPGHRHGVALFTNIAFVTAYVFARFTRTGLLEFQCRIAPAFAKFQIQKCLVVSFFFMVVVVSRWNGEFFFPPFVIVNIIGIRGFPDFGFPLLVTACIVFAIHIPIIMATAAAAALVMHVAHKFSIFVRNDRIFIAIMAILSFVILAAYTHRGFARYC